MFAGKTSELIRLYLMAVELGLSILVLSHASDARYARNYVVSHDGAKVPCRSVLSLGDVNISHYHIIFVDEGQFMPELLAFCNNAIEAGKIVHVFGLSQDYLLREFRAITELHVLAHKIHKLKGVCTKCGGDATVTARITEDTERIVIGSAQYEPRCEECHTIPRTPEE
jgi:thymidine kinase